VVIKGLLNPVIFAFRGDELETENHRLMLEFNFGANSLMASSLDFQPPFILFSPQANSREIMNGPIDSLIIVCCHAIWLGGPTAGADESEWSVLAPSSMLTPPGVQELMLESQGMICT